MCIWIWKRDNMKREFSSLMRLGSGSWFLQCLWNVMETEPEKGGGGRRHGEQEWHSGESANPLSDLFIWYGYKSFSKGKYINKIRAKCTTYCAPPYKPIGVEEQTLCRATPSPVHPHARGASNTSSIRLTQEISFVGPYSCFTKMAG